jgi:hypothetical protein
MCEENMQTKARLLLLFFMLTSSVVVLASERQEHIYLTQIVNQLDAIKPLIQAASRVQPKTHRRLFHYTAWQDAKNKWHPGLLDDLNQIESRIEKKLNHVEPALFLPIQGDYLTPNKRQSRW